MPLQTCFRRLVASATHRERAHVVHPDVDLYLVELLVSFSRTEQLYRLRDRAGNVLRYVHEMLPEGDVRLNANSFEREREVHKHIGDFILFAAGLYPACLGAKPENYTRQGRMSYFVVSTFDFPPHDVQAPTYGRLSADFEFYVQALRWVGEQLPLAA